MSENTATRDDLLQQFRQTHNLSPLSIEDLNLSLTHRSYAFENSLEADNERLEFLGDAILSAATSEHLYNSFSDFQEGELSKWRGRLVSRAMLGRRASELGLGPLLLLGVGETKTGGSRRRSVLGGALEALIGIVYLRGGYDEAKRFILEHIIQPLMREMAHDPVQGDFKSALQEWSQRLHGCLPIYRRLSERGPDHDKIFSVEVEINGQILAEGSGPRIKVAENEAARIALAKLQEENKDA